VALFEIHVLGRGGVIETRYTDRAVRLGDRLTIGARTLVVSEGVPTPVSPLATAAFMCAEERQLPVRSIRKAA
jgi:hypothetical protein